jgi:hypothetical protein
MTGSEQQGDAELAAALEQVEAAEYAVDQYAVLLDRQARGRPV